MLDLALYAGALAGVLLCAPLWGKLACSVFAGMTLARMFSLAHNAAHENIVEGPRLNRFIATVLFTAILYNRRLWTYEHHMLHHPFTNDTKSDAYKPFTKDEFDALPAWRRALERFYRAPNLLGWGAYYLIQRHFSTKVYVPSYVHSAMRAAAWRNTALVIGWMLALWAFLWMVAPHAVGLTPLSSWLLGFLVPFLVFEIHDGFALYVQHTDPRIPWFKGDVDRNAEGRTELLSVHLEVPRLMGWFYHDTFSHPVHHLHPKIPCYRAYAAQRMLDARLGPAAVVSKFGLAWLMRTTRACKLYDWDAHQWLDFHGRPTAAPIRIGEGNGQRSASRAAMQSGLARRRSQAAVAS